MDKVEFYPLEIDVDYISRELYKIYGVENTKYNGCLRDRINKWEIELIADALIERLRDDLSDDVVMTSVNPSEGKLQVHVSGEGWSNLFNDEYIDHPDSAGVDLHEGGAYDALCEELHDKIHVKATSLLNACVNDHLKCFRMEAVFDRLGQFSAEYDSVTVSI